MKKNIYVTDAILLFNPQLDKGLEAYEYPDIESGRVRLHHIGIVYFLTGDINSVFGITAKMFTIFEKVRPLAVVLKDDNSEKMILPVHLPGMFLRRMAEGKETDRLLEKAQIQIDKLAAWNGKKRYDPDKQPLYIKATMSYGIQSGGAVAHSAGVLKALEAKGVHPAVYTTDYIPQGIVKREALHHISLKGYHDFPAELGKLYLNLSAYREICDLQKGKIPSFIYQRYEMNDYIGLKLARKYNVPFVLEFNGSAIWINKNWAGALKYGKIVGQIEKVNFEKADLIVCVSEALKDVLLAQGVPSEKILVAYNGVDEKKYTPDVDNRQIREKYGIGNKIVIGFCGSFGKFHGAEKLAEAYGNLLLHNQEYRDNTYLLMIGEGMTLPKVQRILKSLRADANSCCTGSVPFEEMPSYLAACDILVAPHGYNRDGSPFFGSPTKLFEYMAMGKAIAASDLEQIGHILNDRKTALLFEPGNVEEMETALLTLIEGADLREQLGRKAREEAVAKYTWEKHVEKILTRLNEMYV